MNTDRAATSTIGGYLLDRLHALGLRHIFGIPGDYVLSLYQLIEESPIQHIGTTREDCAGFAADAYARLNGIGAACVTYCVGGLNTMNAVACAYAERSPVVLLSGSPGLNERQQNPLLHHMVRDFATQRDVFEHITVYAAILDDPQTACREIDRALAALSRYKRPIYLEIPRDLVHAPVTVPARADDAEQGSDPETVREAVAEVRAMLAAAKKPVMLAGAEIHRFGLQDALLQLVERLQIPVAATLLGKSVIREDHPLYIGIYGGLIGRDEINQFVDESDCCLMLGSILTDLDVEGDFPAIGASIHATADAIAVKRHQYPNARFEDFVRALAEAPLESVPPRLLPSRGESPFTTPEDDSPATISGLYGLIDTLFGENTIILADVGESMFASVDLRSRRESEFLAPAYYTSMGFAMPAAVGAGFAKPGLRALVLVGDGAFQMTGTEISTSVRHGHAPIVVVLNNRGYSTEREILEGPFNDIPEWNYEQVCALVGGGVPHVARTHGEARDALRQALADATQAHVINVLLDPDDRSAAMRRVAGRLASRMAFK